MPRTTFARQDLICTAKSPHPWIKATLCLPQQSAVNLPPELTTPDIDGANRYGWDSVLVRTGVYPGGEPAKKPAFIADDAELAVDWAWRRELAKAVAKAKE